MQAAAQILLDVLRTNGLTRTEEALREELDWLQRVAHSQATLLLPRAQPPGAAREYAVFHDGKPQPQPEGLAHLSLPNLFNPNVNGLAATKTFEIAPGQTVAGRYRVSGMIGQGSFARAFCCRDMLNDLYVCVKIVNNDKETYDAGLSEVCTLSMLRDKDAAGAMPVSRMCDYFYFREHLFIVTELLGDSLRALAVRLGDEDRLAYFGSKQTRVALSEQLLRGAAFLHECGLVHTDLKPDNICVASFASRHFKIIDLGGSVRPCDTLTSYVASRWYRAPEVILGLPWDSGIDVWAIGCVLAEMLLGRPIFYAIDTNTGAGVLASQVALLGPLPAAMCTAAPLASAFLTENEDNMEGEATPFVVNPIGEQPGVFKVVPPHGEPRLKATLCDLVDDEAYVELILFLLELDPTQRPDARSLQSIAWFREGPRTRNPLAVPVPRGETFSAQLLATATREEESPPRAEATPADAPRLRRHVA